MIIKSGESGSLFNFVLSLSLSVQADDVYADILLSKTCVSPMYVMGIPTIGKESLLQIFPG